MNIYINPSQDTWADIFVRPKENFDVIKERVEAILKNIEQKGDSALFCLTKQIDGAELSPETLSVNETEIIEVVSSLDDNFKTAVQNAKRNIEKFHTAQLRKTVTVETMPGVVCEQRRVPIKRVGLYIPGGSAPLFSTVLMSVVPAKIAGCSEIILSTPADKNGHIAPEIIYTAELCGVDKIYKLGGAIAIGAMAYGTESIVAVDKIFGPGNRYVTYAKQCVSRDRVAIDMPAGPSEVMVVGDSSSRPAFIAADLLSQLEHGADSQAIALVSSEDLALNVKLEVLRQAKLLSRDEIIKNAMNNCNIIVVDKRDTMLKMVDYYAPEHLIVSLNDADDFAYSVTNAGSIFIGNYSPESVGDYASGTNHTLPTSGWAKSFSGVNTDSFSKYITYQKLSEEGLQSISLTTITMAEHEGLTAHAAAVKIRINKN